MITYGATCPHCKGAVKIEVSVQQLRVLVSGVAPPRNGGRVKPGITEDLQPDTSTFRPADPPTCPTCGVSAMFIQEVARKSGREFKARKCINRDCSDFNKFVPNSFRWVGQGATV